MSTVYWNRYIRDNILARYFAVGGIAACTDISLFFVFAKLMGFNYLWVAAFSFLVGTLVNYALSIRFVFDSGKKYNRRTELVLVYLISLTGLLLHQVALLFFVESLLFGLLTAKFMATGLVFSWNYLMRRSFVFAR